MASHGARGDSQQQTKCLFGRQQQVTGGTWHRLSHHSPRCRTKLGTAEPFKSSPPHQTSISTRRPPPLHHHRCLLLSARHSAQASARLPITLPQLRFPTLSFRKYRFSFVMHPPRLPRARLPPLCPPVAPTAQPARLPSPPVRAGQSHEPAPRKAAAAPARLRQRREVCPNVSGCGPCKPPFPAPLPPRRAHRESA
ncbi:hypothetical protein P154DRAFT_569996 [Amniculicola lignicola CBS 123094]|uniref:Uncharacterized protein n=1 Tax=Amniculicola lignicola CBS 123094 TaxID=1392246 RepID=A0A6A5WY01_9PLEO|nr:hypothetical protein P154DRAFT_569996 [Amniculicola lignicola CBS 123094]